MVDCIFCKIIAGEIPAKFIRRDDDVVAIADANPQAPSHLLVMPSKHIANIADLAGLANAALLSRVFDVATKLGKEHGKHGFRLVVNSGADGGQTVDHMHVHVLSGRFMEWPPG